MVTRTLLLAAALFGALGARAECTNPAVPGTSIGPVKIGMALEEVKKLGEVTPVNPEWSAVKAVQFKLGKDRKVDTIRYYSSAICVVLRGKERMVDMTTDDTKYKGIGVPGCEGSTTGARAGWECKERGFALFWEGRVRPGVEVRRPSESKPYRGAPPPPPWLARKGMPEIILACQGSPHPELACAFFGKAPSVSLECYLPDPCMGVFAADANDRVEVFQDAHSFVGTMRVARDGKALAIKFESPPKPKSVVRVLIDTETRTAPAFPLDGATSRKVVAVAGGWKGNSAMVLDLEVPVAVEAP